MFYFMAFASGFLGGVIFFVVSFLLYHLMTEPFIFMCLVILGEMRTTSSRVVHIYTRTALTIWLVIIVACPLILIYLLGVSLEMLTIPGLIGLYVSQISLFLLWLDS